MGGIRRINTVLGGQQCQAVKEITKYHLTLLKLKMVELSGLEKMVP